MPESVFTSINTGELLDLMHPERTTFRMANVAQAMSNICRFAGQIKRGVFYSVAEHSVYVSLLEEAMGGTGWGGLWHDASEGLGMNDVVSPLKRVLTPYVHIEDLVMAEVAHQFRFTWPLSSEVKLADSLMCEAEGRAIVLNWHLHQKRLGRVVAPEHEHWIADRSPVCLSPDLAYQLFVMRLKAVAAKCKPFPRLELQGA